MSPLIFKNTISTFAAYRRYLHKLVLGLFAIVFAYLSLSEPTLNWDILPYVANALQYLGDQPIEQLHQSIYQNLAKQVSAEELATFTNTPSRVVIAQDPEAFRQTIAFFYDARLVYIGMVAAMASLGVDPFFATYLISTICAILSVFLLANLVPKQLPIGLCFALPFIALACGILNVARLSTPDSLATLVTIGLYWLLFRNRVGLLLILLPFTVFVRTDLILLMPLFVAYLWVFERASRIKLVLSAVLTVAAYLTLNHVIVEGDPWSSLIGYNYGEKPTHPDTFSFPISVSDYLSFIVTGLKSFSYNPMFFMFCALAITGIFLFASRFYFNPDNKPASLLHLDLLFLLVSCVLYIVMHFMLFPVTWIRFFAAQYTLVAVIVLWATLAILAERNYSERSNNDLLTK